MLNCLFEVLEKGSVECLTKGNVYSVEEGKFVNDAGVILPLDKNLFELSDLEEYLGMNITWNGAYRPPRIKVI